jgi:hypothetical protein
MLRQHLLSKDDVLPLNSFDNSLIKLATIKDENYQLKYS